MKKLGLFIIILCGIFLAQGLALAQDIYGGRMQVDAKWRENPAANIFYQDLIVYGRWIFHDTYGLAWQPYRVYADWRPYTIGHWAYTDYGWLWVSDEPWGWVTYHYGRWFFDDKAGWLWYPGDIWAPAWVIWRYGPGWIGWAPLPPYIVWGPGLGLEFTYLEQEEFIPYHSFCFVETRFFTVIKIIEHIVIHKHNPEIIKATKVVSDFKKEGQRVVNSLPVAIKEDIERSSGQSLRELKVVEADSPLLQREDRQEARIFRPKKEGLERIEVRPQEELKREAPRIDKSGPRRFETPRIQTLPEERGRIERIERIDKSGPSRLEPARIQQAPQPAAGRIERIEPADKSGPSQKILTPMPDTVERLERIEHREKEKVEVQEKSGKDVFELRQERIKSDEDGKRGKGRGKEEVLEEEKSGRGKGIRVIEPKFIPPPELLR